MASRAIVPAQNKAGDGKNKNGGVDGRNRKALGDIGNVVNPAPPITRPITRRFGAQLIANAEAEAEVEKNKEGAGQRIGNEENEIRPPKATSRSTKNEENKDGNAKPVVVQKIQKKKEKNEEEDVEMRSAVACRKANKKRLKITLTSVLSARGKLACGLASRPEELLVNIDENDESNELAAVVYVDAMYEFYREAEEERRVPDYMDSQTEINGNMRSILIDWMIDVHTRFELMPETLYLAVNLIDRYLSLRVTRRRELQLVGMGSLLIASKYEEIWAPEVDDFIAISDNAYFREQLLAMERSILDKLEWEVTVPTPYVFLLRFLKASRPEDDVEVEKMASFLLELGLMHYPIIIECSSSKMAACAVYAARKSLERRPLWTRTLTHYTGYPEEGLVDGAKSLDGVHRRIAEGKPSAAYKKFSADKLGGGGGDDAL